MMGQCPIIIRTCPISVQSSSYDIEMYPGVLAVSMRKYVHAVLLLTLVVPLPSTREVEHE